MAFPLPLARELTITADMPQWTAAVISRYIQDDGWVGEMECVRDLYMCMIV